MDSRPGAIMLARQLRRFHDAGGKVVTVRPGEPLYNEFKRQAEAIGDTGHRNRNVVDGRRRLKEVFDDSPSFPARGEKVVVASVHDGRLLGAGSFRRTADGISLDQLGTAHVKTGGKTVPNPGVAAAHEVLKQARRDRVPVSGISSPAAARLYRTVDAHIEPDGRSVLSSKQVRELVDDVEALSRRQDLNDIRSPHDDRPSRRRDGYESAQDVIDQLRPDYLRDRPEPHPARPHDAGPDASGTGRTADTGHAGDTGDTDVSDGASDRPDGPQESDRPDGPHGSDEPIVHEGVRDRATEFADRLREVRADGHISARAAGQVVAAGVDRRFGEVIDANNGRPGHSIPLDQLHPVLRERLERMRADGPYPQFDKDGSPRMKNGEQVMSEHPHSDDPLRHAEVKIVNRLLWRRGVDADASVLRDFNVDTRFPFGADGVRPAPFCPNCNRLLEGVGSQAGSRTHVVGHPDQQIDPR